jgi:hypothetical protein
MKRRARMPLLLAPPALAAALLWFEPTGVVRGWLRGEAFYDGRPTSYWSRELQTWRQEGRGYYGWTTNDGETRKLEAPSWRRDPGLWDRWEAGTWHVSGVRMTFPPPLEAREARDVLLELLDDPSPQVRRMAAIGLARIEERPGYFE